MFEIETLSPALVALVMNEAKVTDDVLLRELACLADSGWLRFEQQASATPMVRVVRRPEKGDLRQSEAVALNWVGQRAGDQPDVPLSAILDRQGTDARQWWGRYAAALLSEAKAAGLTWQPIGDHGAYAVMAGSAATFGLAVSGAGAVIGLALLVALVTSMFPGLTLALALMKPRLTRAGRRMARQALRGGGDPPPEGGTPIPNVALLPSGQAWSSFGGQWHTVTVAAKAVRTRQELQGDRTETAEMVGQVVRRWMRSQWAGGQHTGRTEYHHYCCIDDGVAAEGKTFSLSHADFDELTVGDVVRFGIDPNSRLRFVHEPAEGTQR